MHCIIIQHLFDIVTHLHTHMCSSLVFQDRTSTITSLEELLNVTGINQTEEINFSEIAREVEAQHGTCHYDGHHCWVIWMGCALVVYLSV